MNLFKRHLLPMLICYCLMVFFIFGCVNTPTAKIGDTINYQNTRQFITPHIEEDGSWFQFEMNTYDCLKCNILVQIFGEDKYLLGEKNDEAIYENTQWKKFGVFIPYSRIGRFYDTYKYDIYVLSPTNSDAYLAQARVENSNLTPLNPTWELLDYEEDAVMADGGSGIRLKFNLWDKGSVGNNLKSMLSIKGKEDGKCSTFQMSTEEISIRLTASHDRGVWRDLVFNVPYALLDNIDPSCEIIITPVFQINDALQNGNIHLHFWAGGSFQRTKDRLSDRIKNLNQRIRHIEKEMEALKEGN